MSQRQEYGHLTFEQLMRFKRDKLREISKYLSIPYYSNTLKQDLATNIYNHFNNTPASNIDRDYKIRDSIPEKINTKYILTESYLDYFIKVYTKSLNNYSFNNEIDNDFYNDHVNIFVEDLIDKEYPYFKYILNKLKYPYKFRTLIKATFKRPQGEPAEFDLHSRYFYPYEENLLELLKSEFTTRIEDLKMEQTGWTLTSFNEIELHIQKVNIFPGGTYQKLPVELSRRKALVNIDNSKYDDNKCFLWSVLAHFIHKNVTDPTNISNYIPHMSSLNTTNLTFPVITDNNLNNSISKFENDNNLIINIYALTNEENPNSVIAPIRVSKNVKERYQQVINYYDQNNIINLDPNQKTKFETKVTSTLRNINSQTINLFLYKNHFMYISNFNALFSRQFDKHRNI